MLEDELAGAKYVAWFDGKPYTAAMVAEKTGLKLMTIYKRISRGETLQSVLDTPKRRKVNEGRLYNYKGQQLTLRQISELPECMVSYTLLMIRVCRYGWPVEKAAAEAKMKDHRRHSAKKYPFRGKEYTLRELSELPECMVKLNTLRARVYRYHWSINKALRTPYADNDIWE